MVRKSFKAAVRDNEIEFDTSEGDTFRARPKMAAGVILRFTDAVSPDDPETFSLTKMIAAISEFFRSAIVPEDLDRFTAMLDDPDKGVALDELTDIAAWLATLYTARPTGTDSPGGSRTSPTGTDSTDGASPKVLTFSRKEPEPEKTESESEPVGSSV